MILATNQYGDTIVLKTNSPRKELAEQYGVSSSSLQKMYVDTKAGDTKHIGYIVLGLWFTFHNLTEWTGRV